jgi:hypothetical protein
MPLQKQVVPIPLTKGIDKGIANVLRPSDSLDQGTNIEQLVTGELTKRTGFQSIDTTIGTGVHLFEAKGSIGVIEANSVVEILDPVSNTLRELTVRNSQNVAVNEVLCKVKDLLGSDVSIESYDCLAYQSYIYVACYVTGGSGSASRLYKFDRNLNNVGYSGVNTYAGISGTAFRFAGERLFVNNSGTMVVYNFLTASTVSASLLTLGGNQIFDVVEWSSGGFAISFDDGSNIVNRLLNSSFGTIGSTNFSRTNVNSVCVFNQTAGDSFYVGVTRSTGTIATTYRFNSTPSIVETRDYTSTLNGYNCCGIRSGANAYFFVEAGASSASKDRQILSSQFLANQTGTTSGNTFVNPLRRAGLASRPFLIGITTEPYLFVAHKSEDSLNLQNCYFLMQCGTDNSSYEGLTKIHSQLVYGKNRNYITDLSFGNKILPQVSSFSSSEYFMPIFSRVDSGYNLSASSSVFGLSACFVNTYNGINSSKSVSFQDETFISSNGVLIFDGNQLNEFGFYLYPDPIQSSTNTSAGNVADGTYQYVVVYEYFDARGDLLESAPSQVFTTTYAAGSARQYTLTLNLVGFSTKQNMRVSIYRTTASGTIFYFLGSINNLTGSTLTYVDNIADATLQTNKILYTTGGVAENIISPNSNFVCQAKNRLWTFETGSTDTIWFSKEIRSGFLPAFSDLLVQKVSSAGGELVALAQIDDKLIIFKERIIMALLGDGPTESLVGSFSVPLQITSGMGCVTARSVVETPVGIFYASQEGIYLVDRSLQNSFIGRPIYKNEGTIRSSVYDPVLNRVIFLTTTQMIVYYISTASWYTWTATNPVDLLLEGGVLYQLTSTKLLKQGTGYQDDSANYAQTLKLGQFSFAGLQAYQRLYRVLITGRSTSDANTTNLTVKNYFNSNTTATDTLTLQHSSAISNNRFELEVRPSVQKCETMEIELSLTANTSGFIVSGMSAEVGVLPGAARRAESRRAT